ncbi:MULTISPECIES: flagellin [unclassified Thioalkalivibrio]|uniref:flagellin N-terminal helical domain-containing protein n=1 Tax=unclassified Thioalkalivibrio TaxID=2621013 RepID=UPI00037F03CC|nr:MULTISPECIES: flagellin [unclassified Thioalkalivibrio]
MSQIINTNIMSLNAQRNLSNSQGALAQSLERLSSGLRINSAKDDAAGLAISERFTTQIRGLNQAVRNANDGISLAQTGEGALQEVQNNLQRIRELAVQSANATNSDSDREAINREVQQRLQEIDRIADQTSFNGQKILDGSFGDAKFQVGANVGETIDLNLESSTRLGDIGKMATATSDADFGEVLSAGTPELTIGGFGDLDFDEGDGVTGTIEMGGETLTISAGDVDDLEGLATEINGWGGLPDGVQASVVDGELVIGLTEAYAGGDLAIDVNLSDDTGEDANTVGPRSVIAGSNSTTSLGPINNLDLSTGGSGSFTYDFGSGDVDVTFSWNEGDSGGDVATAITNAIDENNITVIYDGTNLLVENNDTTDFVITDFEMSDNTGTESNTVQAAGTLTPAQTIEVGEGDFTIRTGDNESVEVAAGTYSSQQDLIDAMNAALVGEARAFVGEDGQLNVRSSSEITIGGTVGLNVLNFSEENEPGGSLAGVDVLTVANANNVIERVDSALTAVSDIRSDFGAIQNRFESTISNLTQTSENLEESRSRIRDADFATETAELTRAQILQQAGTSVLSQANAVPQNALALLQ